MIVKTLLSICCSILIVSTVEGQEKNQINDPNEGSHQLMNERVSELMADRVGFKKDLVLEELAAINEMEELEAKEDLMFPADELYGSHWANDWVDPFRGMKVTYPDSCVIDCSAFVFPLDTMTRVTSKFGPRRRRMHKGIDLKVQVGDTIYAAFDGKVRIRKYERRGYGYYLVIRHPNGLETIYGHLSKFLVNLNDVVRGGQPIALGGNTGRSTGSHLHFETRFMGQALNPQDLIDFENEVPHKDTYVFHNVKINGRKSNIYTSSDTKVVYHRVKSGDTLEKIARRYGTSINELCRLNGLKRTSILRIGQSIRCNAGIEVAATNNTVEQPKTVEKVEVEIANVATTTEATSDPETLGDTEETPIYHKIKSGDTLGGIAAKYGTTVQKLCELNGITRTTILRLGRSLRCS